jgi:hypothetical protein
LIDLKATIRKMRVRNVTLQYTHHIDAESEHSAKWRFLKDKYDSATDTTEKIIISLWNAILFQERKVFTITREKTRELLANDLNWPDRVGFANRKWEFMLLVAVESGLIQIVQVGDKTRPSIYEVTDPQTLSFLPDADREQQLEEAMEFVGLEDETDSEKELQNTKNGPGREKERGLRGLSISEPNNNDELVTPIDRGPTTGDVEGRSKKVEGRSKIERCEPDSNSEPQIDVEIFSAMVRTDVESAITSDKKTYPKRLVPLIRSMVAAYGDQVSMGSIREGINRSLSPEARKRAYEIAQEAYGAAIDAWRTRDLTRPNPVRSLSAEERSAQIEAEYSKRFVDITEEILAQIAAEKENRGA